MSSFLHERSVPSKKVIYDDTYQKAENIINEWKNATLLDQEDFKRRLRYDNLDLNKAKLIIAGKLENKVDIRKDEVESFYWRNKVEEIISNRYSHVKLPNHKTEQGWSIMFEGFFAPFLKYGTQKLDKGIRKIKRDYRIDNSPLSESCRYDLVTDLLFRIWRPSLPTLILELNVDRVRGNLKGKTPEERYRYFSKVYLYREDRRRSLLEEYGVLSRLLMVKIQRWKEATLEFCRRYVRDKDILNEEYLSGKKNKIRNIETGVSDPHEGGKSVIMIETESGNKLVYKPSPLGAAKQIQNLIGILNDLESMPLEHRTINVINREGYGWLEHVEAEECNTNEQLERFYWRQGSLLALLHALMAIDFHYENLVAAGEYPVLVDLETFFHRDVQTPEHDAEGLAKAHLRRSVLRAAFLPFLMGDLSGENLIDMSGLGGEGGQEVTRLHDVVKQKTDEMHLTRGRGEVDSARNRPKLNGNEVNVADFTEYIVSGFEDTYRCLMTNKSRIIQEVRKFEGKEVRHLFRKTMQYTLFRREGRHPNNLRDGVDRNLLLDRLWAKITDRPNLEPVVRHEIDDLLLEDIPRFTTSPESKDLCASDGSVIDDFFDQSGLDQSIDRIKNLSEENLERQTYIIRMSLASMPESELDGLKASPSVIDLKGQNEKETTEKLMSTAIQVGEYLQSKKVSKNGTATWFGLTQRSDAKVHQSDRREVALAPGHLYSGVSGIALFFIYLTDVTNRSDFLQTTKETLSTLRAQLDRKETSEMTAAGYTGYFSYLYTLSHASKIIDKPSLLDDCRDFKTMRVLMNEENSIDIVNGKAGAALVLLNLYQETHNERYLQLAQLCGDVIVNTLKSESPGSTNSSRSNINLPPGFSHGLAGLSLTLARIRKQSGKPGFSTWARRAISWEREIFDPENGAWNHRRVAWCHGSPGIALARSLASNVACDTVAEDEINRGISDILSKTHYKNPALCHGTLGNADILLSIGRRKKDPALIEQGKALALQIAKRTDWKGKDKSLPRYSLTPGLMNGIAGVGYGLLRCALPNYVPSVLSLEPVIQHQSRV